MYVDAIEFQQIQKSNFIHLNILISATSPFNSSSFIIIITIHAQCRQLLEHTLFRRIPRESDPFDGLKLIDSVRTRPLKCIWAIVTMLLIIAIAIFTFALQNRYSKTICGSCAQCAAPHMDGYSLRLKMPWNHELFWSRISFLHWNWKIWEHIDYRGLTRRSDGLAYIIFAAASNQWLWKGPNWVSAYLSCRSPWNVIWSVWRRNSYSFLGGRIVASHNSTTSNDWIQLTLC